MKISQTLPGWTAPEARGQPGVTERPLEQPGRHQEVIWIAREAPSTQQVKTSQTFQAGLPAVEPTHAANRADRHRPAGRHQGGRKGPFGSWTAWEAPGRKRTAREAPGTSREAGKDHLDSQPGRHHGLLKAILTTEAGREAGKDLLDSLGGTREAPGRQERSLRGTREAPGGTREAGKDQLDSLGGTREAGKDSLDSLDSSGSSRATRSH